MVLLSQGDFPHNLAVLELIPVATYLCDRQGKISFYNQAAALFWGSVPHLGETDEHFWATFKRWNWKGEPFSADTETALTQVLRTGQAIQETTFVVEKRDGSEVAVSLKAVPIVQDGEVVGAIATLQDITQQRKAEQLLQSVLPITLDRCDRQPPEQTHQSFHSIADAIPQIFWTCTADGAVEYFNQPALETFGIPLEHLCSEGWSLLIHPDDRQRTLETWKNALTTGDRYQLESRLKMADGSYRWHRVQALPNRTPKSNITRWFGTCIDIEDSKRLEAALQQQTEALENQRRWLEAVLNLLPLPLIFLEPQTGHFTFCNQAANQMAGGDLPRDRPIGIYRADFYCTDAKGYLIPPSQLPAVRAAQGEKIHGAELNWHTPTEVYPLLVDAETLPAMYGRPTTTVMLFQDIRDRKQLEAELRQQEQKFRTITENSPDIISRLDPQFRHLYVSPAIERVTGLPSTAFIGKTNAELGMPVELCHRWHKNLQQVFTTGQELISEFSFPALDGIRWYQARLVPEFAPDGSVASVLGISRDITDYKQTEQALRRSEERYRSLAESLPQLAYMTDADGIPHYCNSSWLDYTGLTLEETRDGGWQQVIHPDDRSLASQQWTQALATGKGDSIEFRLRRVDGVYRWHLVRTVPLKREDGSISGWLGTATDIDRQKLTEQRSRFLAQASQIFAAASLDLQTVLHSVTRLAGKLTGDLCVLNLLSEDGQWLNAASLYHDDPEVQALSRELMNRYPRRADKGLGGQVMQTGEPLLLPVSCQQDFKAVIKPEYQLYLEQFPVCSILIVPLKVQGQAIGFLSLTRNQPAEPHNREDLSLFQDLADRAAMAIANAQLYRQAERSRQQAQQTADRTARLQSVTAALSEPIAPAQVAQVIAQQSTAALKAAAALVAICSERGTELEIVHSIGHQAEIIEAWRRFPIASANPLSEAVRRAQPIWEQSLEERKTRYPHLKSIYDRYEYAGWISLPLMVEGRAVGGISLSFHEFLPLSQSDRAFTLALCQQAAQAIARAQLYEAEQRARANAEAANRTKDEFLTVLSHELRTPLNPILGWTALLRRGKLDRSKTAIALETIERNAKLQVQLIEDLLDISRILQGKMVLNRGVVALKTTVEAALETVQLAAQAKGIQIQTNFVTEVRMVLGDATRLQQVFWNLLSNAVKFTPAGGQVEVRLETHDCLVHFQVKDSGKGIKQEFLPYIFDYFRQADSSITRTYGGLGVGLAIARHIVELHGGTIAAESLGDGCGATFTVTLPLMAIATSQIEDVELSVNNITLGILD
ncbi:MAG: PAS domain S-box protein [Actinomycetota bacterium]